MSLDLTLGFRSVMKPKSPLSAWNRYHLTMLDTLVLGLRRRQRVQLTAPAEGTRPMRAKGSFMMEQVIISCRDGARIVARKCMKRRITRVERIV